MTTNRRYRSRYWGLAIQDSTPGGRRENFRQLRWRCRDSNSETNRWPRSDSRCASNRQTHRSSRRYDRLANRRAPALRSRPPLATVVADRPMWLHVVRCRRIPDPSCRLRPERRLGERTFFRARRGRRHEMRRGPSGCRGSGPPRQFDQPAIAKTLLELWHYVGTGKPSKRSRFRRRTPIGRWRILNLPPAA